MKEEYIRQIIQEELQKFKQQNLSTLSWQKVGTVTDQFTPISPASMQIGFYGKALITKQTVSGSRGANAALASALTALANLGLITDSSS